MSVKGGITTVKINGEIVSITDLDPLALCREWAKLKRELNDLYAINARANSGWRGLVLRLIGVYLPDKNVIYLGGVDGEGKSLYLDQFSIKK